MTLTEQWKKGELKSGWYFVKVGNYEAEIDLYDDDQNQWFNCCDKDIYPVEILAPVPSYEEWQGIKVLKETRGKCLSILQDENEGLNEENKKLKELLKEAKDIIEWYKADCGYKDTPTEAILTKIDNAIGEKR